MRLQCETTGEWITLIQIIHKGGEAKIWETSKSGLVAKIYTKPMIPDTWPKLRLMINNPPQDPTLNKGHVSIVWPKCILVDNSGKPKGFLLPFIANTLEFSIIHHPKDRKQKVAGFSWNYLHTVAMNIASLMQCIHQKNYVIGDINSRNILVKLDTYVSIIDTDSFQVTDPQTQKVYRCTVGVDEYRPPEMFGKDAHKIDRYEAQDRFGLAILIWQLLFNDHPFYGKWNGRGEPPTVAEKISQGHWVYGANSNLTPVKRMMPFHIIHPQLQTLFRRCFDDGHRNPPARPTAGEWKNALELAIKDLQVCSVKGQQHYYARTYGKCYWCERAKLIGVDIFANPSGASTPSPSILSSPLPTILKTNLSPNIPKPPQPTIPTPLTNLNIPRPPQPTIPTFIGVPTPPKTTPLPTKPTDPFIQWVLLTIARFKSSPTQQWIVGVGLCILSIAVYASWSSHVKKTPSQPLVTQSQNTKPENTIIQYYKLTTTNKKAAIELLSVRWRKEATEKINNPWWDLVNKVEFYTFRTFAKSKTNATIKVWLKYDMKNGETACESRIFKLIYDANSNQWLMDSFSDVVQKDYCDNQ